MFVKLTLPCGNWWSDLWGISTHTSVTLGDLFLLYSSITCRRCCIISHRALCLCRTTSMGSCRRRVRCPGWSTTTSRHQGPSSSWTSWRRSWASTSTRTSPRRREPCPELSPKWSRNISTGGSQLCLYEPVKTLGSNLFPVISMEKTTLSGF